MSRDPRERAATARESASGPADFRLAGRLVQPALHRVVEDGATVTLEPKLMRVLVLLASRPGEVVSKEELFADVWEGAFVTEDVLTRAIGELRRTFGDDAAHPRVIETIRKSGYRLIAPVEAGLPPGVVTAEDPDPAGGDRVRRSGRRLAAALTAAALLLAVGFAIRAVSRARAAPAGPMRVRPLTTFPGNERDPAVSPDGSRVAYVWNGGSGDAHSLYVQLVDADSPLRLTAVAGVEDRAPAWSPDGQRIAFTRASGKDCSILVVSSLGGPEKRIAPCGDPEYRRLAWSPDGAWLALSVRDAATSQLAIVLLSPETLERRTVTRPPGGILGDTSPAFSPDGREIAFSRNVTDGVGDVYRISRDGGEPKRLTFDDRDTMGVDWAPDGRSIFFSSSRAGIYSLWRVAYGGGEPSWVAGGGAKMKHPSAARAKNLVAYESWIYQVSLWRVPADGSAGGERLTSATDEWDFEPDVSPDGEQVAFVSTRSGEEEVWVVPQRGGEPIRVTSYRGARIERPRWSPDGKRLVYSVRRGRRAEVEAVAVSGGVPERLTSGDADAVAPTWSRDGHAVYFGSRRSGAWRVWRLDLASRRLEPATPDGGYAAQESRDGGRLFYTRADSAGIWSLRPGSAPERIVASLAPEDWANWQVAADGIYYRELCGEHPEPRVVFQPFAGRTTHLAPLDDQGWAGLSVTGDGKWLLYPRVERHTCDVMLIEHPPGA